jgi:hypothetical protein
MTEQSYGREVLKIRKSLLTIPYCLTVRFNSYQKKFCVKKQTDVIFFAFGDSLVKFKDDTHGWFKAEVTRVYNG